MQDVGDEGEGEVGACRVTAEDNGGGRKSGVEEVGERSCGLAELRWVRGVWDKSWSNGSELMHEMIQAARCSSQYSSSATETLSPVACALALRKWLTSLMCGTDKGKA